MAASITSTALLESLLGCSLTQATHTNERHVLRLERDYLPIKTPHLTAVSSVKIGTTDATALTQDSDTGYDVELFGIRRRYPYLWPRDTIIFVSYTSGYADSGAWPQALQDAAALLDAWLATNPEAVPITEDKLLGEATVSYLEGPARADYYAKQVLPLVQSLLKGYRALHVY